jgi:hypothetical protein
MQPVSSLQAHTQSVADGGRPAAPIQLADIDRALRDSAGVADAGSGTPVRAWRDELAVALDSLLYARAVLSADVAILRHRLSGDPEADGPVVHELPQALSSRPWGKGWSSPAGSERPSQVDWEIFARSDGLMSAHAEMAHVDLSSRDDVTRVLGAMEAQLADLTVRQEAVEARLRDIRAAIVREYRDGAVATEDWPA